MGGDGRFNINLEDEVVRGAIVLRNGDLLPPVPRAMPQPAAPAIPNEAAVETVAITPWKKACREVAIITTGMGGTVALGKATGMAFMSNFFTFGLAGLVGYRWVRVLYDGFL